MNKLIIRFQVPAFGNQVTSLPVNSGTGLGGQVLGTGQVLSTGQQPPPTQLQVVRPVHQQETTWSSPQLYQTTTQRTTTTRSSPAASNVCTKSKTEHAGKSICERDLIFHEKFNNWTPGIWKHEIFMPDGPVSITILRVIYVETPP